VLRSRLTRPSFGGATRSFGRAARVINGRLASLTGINDFHPLWGRAVSQCFFIVATLGETRVGEEVKACLK
jgi:hypothetical protein